jgi:Flp pilus assembly protein TadG
LRVDRYRRLKDPQMSSPAASRTSFKGILRRFRRNRHGSAAVEFALVAPMFFALLFAIIEVALMFFASQVLETVTQDAARVVLTGQAQSGLVSTCNNSPCTQATFQSYVCSQIPALFNCNNVITDVEAFPPSSGFSSIVLANGSCTAASQYNPGLSGYIVVVRLSYAWPLYVTGLGFNISNMSGSQRCLSAAAAFQNEPY